MWCDVFCCSDLLEEYSSALSLPATPATPATPVAAVDGKKASRSAVSSTKLLFDVLEGFFSSCADSGGADITVSLPTLLQAFLLQNKSAPLSLSLSH